MQWAVILAGGSGTRFWPLSTPARPKQLLPLLPDGRSTAVQAMERLAGLVPPERILVVTGAALAAPLRVALGLPDANILVEPRAASTAPALVWATAEAARRDPDALVLSLHADWYVARPDAFRTVASAALAAADAHDRLVTVGMVPDRAETGYGYIVAGAPLDGTAREVARFVEKPDAAAAAALLAEGALWNSGLFAWRAGRLLDEVRARTPELADALPALARGDVAAFFAAVRPVSIDVGVLERSARVAVVPGDFGWDDVGTWEALARVRPRDADGNVVVGPVTLVACRDCIAWSDGTPVVLTHLAGMACIAANGRVLVLPRTHAADLKTTLDRLPPEVLALP